jgi:hypothetical protein
MEVQVSWLAVLFATLSTMVVGTIWYTPKVFGNLWIKLTGHKMSGNKNDAVKPILITLVVSLVTAYVLAHVTYLSYTFFDYSWLQAALSTAFWTWLGFTAARIITHDAFEGRPAQLTVLNVAHELVTFLVMGLVIGLFQP